MNGTDSSLTLLVKKMRYYARFFVVCILLAKNDVCSILYDEMLAIVEEYTRTYKPEDSNEWLQVTKEMELFLRIDLIDQRLKPDSISRMKSISSKLSLQSCILISNDPSQVRFSELSVDIFRMMNILERKPNSDKRSNPQKLLLHLPSTGEILMYLASVFYRLQRDSCLLLYVSENNSSLFNSRDLYSFTRKPMFIIYDSINAFELQGHESFFQPIACLSSPKSKHHYHGSDFTAFLYSPIAGLQSLLSVKFKEETVRRIEEEISNIQHSIIAAFDSIEFQETCYELFAQDDFLRLLLLRFIVYRKVMKAFLSVADDCLPVSQPPLPQIVYESCNISNLISLMPSNNKAS